MTINQARAQSLAKLENMTPSPLLDAEILLSFILDKPKEFLYTHPEYTLSSEQIKKFRGLIARRVTGLPIAYLIGYKEFYGLNFIIDKNVLIPRPDTELMVEEALKKIKDLPITRRSLPITFIDVGTGSGCISIAVTKNQPPKTNISCFALDISPAALKIARHNARLHNVSKDIKFFSGHLLQPLLKKYVKMFKCLNAPMVITANLPYLTPAQYRANPDLKYEPKNALVAGSDGLKYYRTLLQQIKTLAAHINSTILFLEIDPSQTTPIKKVIHHYLPKAVISVKKDLARRNRLIIIQLNYK
ncbi:MAG TPA: peptide chain release factor N(5)-glutamine methyltransferase [bacterium]|nr:peptide chain release factor N(5)-glutamine methyltransferase [bacterium]